MTNNNISIAAWRKEVDVNRWEQRPFVILDPLSQSSLLYMTRAEYQQFLITSLANAVEVTVVATPNTPREELGRSV